MTTTGAAPEVPALHPQPSAQGGLGPPEDPRYLGREQQVGLHLHAGDDECHGRGRPGQRREGDDHDHLARSGARTTHDHPCPSASWALSGRGRSAQPVVQDDHLDKDRIFGTEYRGMPPDAESHEASDHLSAHPVRHQPEVRRSRVLHPGLGQPCSRSSSPPHPRRHRREHPCRHSSGYTDYIRYGIGTRLAGPELHGGDVVQRAQWPRSTSSQHVLYFGGAPRRRHRQPLHLHLRHRNGAHGKGTCLAP